jgi:hypothetical protein
MLVCHWKFCWLLAFCNWLCWTLPSLAALFQTKVMRHKGRQQTADSRQHTAYSIQHTAYSIQHTAYSIQHTAYSIQHTAYSIQHTTYNIQHTTYSIQHTAYSIQHTAYSIQHTAYSIQHTAYSLQLLPSHLGNSGHWPFGPSHPCLRPKKTLCKYALILFNYYGSPCLKGLLNTDCWFLIRGFCMFLLLSGFATWRQQQSVWNFTILATVTMLWYQNPNSTLKPIEDFA